jgi:hypothetical protein
VAQGEGPEFKTQYCKKENEIKNESEIISFAGKWMELNITTLSEKSQAQKPNIMFSLICGT